MKPVPVCGWQAVLALLASSDVRRIEQIVLDESRQDPRVTALQKSADRCGLALERVSRKALDRLTRENHQGVIALVRPRPVATEAELDALLSGLEEPPLLLILDGVTDPHNLGACLRSANAAGVHALITTHDRSAPLNDAARKVACGAAEFTPVIRVTNLNRTLKHLQAFFQIRVLGLAGEAEQELFSADLRGALALVMGSEDRGLRRLTRESCDALLRIPMAGEVASLNVSVATGVSLFQAALQRRS